MEFRQLQYFLEAARCGNFTQASINCYVSQSNLSEQIHKLESELNCTLFDRKGRKVRLTAEGDLLRRRCEDIMRLIEDTKNALVDLKSGVTGTIHIGLLPTVSLSWFPLFMTEFRKEFPSVHIKMKELSSSAIEECLENYEIDLAISTVPPKELRFETDVLYTEKLVVIVPENHPLSRIQKRIINLDVIKDEPFIIYEKGQELRDIILKTFFQTNFRPNIYMEIERTESIKYLVQTGHGIALIPETSIHYPTFHGLNFFYLQTPIERTVGILTRQGNFQPEAVRVLISRLLNLDYPLLIRHR